MCIRDRNKNAFEKVMQEREVESEEEEEYETENEEDDEEFIYDANAIEEDEDEEDLFEYEGNFIKDDAEMENLNPRLKQKGGKDKKKVKIELEYEDCLLYTSPSPRDRQKSRMPSSA
eukprot:TRINITY_DN5918_c0_g1_i3.p3 TRINITY_DN5918_c0_g1~~TRINITY_DN5918_c0_g1_i3.p3  ORF type:complete len:117 (+),score=60.28 TRINITY_DN5918_c0_g1_i3:64-414(+)